ncbi:MAG TPA: AraC family transcriptional regulator [Lacibacter sp.]|nr:AraC family transcriptional regulator [Lacibacter sp.]
MTLNIEQNGIKYETYTIDKDIEAYVKSMWSFEATPNDGDYFIYRTYASICPTLFFVVNGKVEPVGQSITENLLLVGQTNRWFRYKASNDFKVFGITFYPFALPVLFNISADKITNQHLDRHAISEFKTMAEFCRQTVQCEYNTGIINSLIKNSVSRCTFKNEIILNFIFQIASGQSEMQRITEKQVFMSQRNFERKFKYFAGFTPKSFANLLRIISSLQAVSWENKKLVDVSYEQEYFDQSHFSNEFKRHIGFQPKVFAKRSMEEDYVWKNFVDFFQFLSICPPVLCRNKH